MKLLDKNDVAELIGVKPKKAAELMMEMNPTPICGKVRKRYRVTEANLDKWIADNSIKPTVTTKGSTGTKRKLGRK